MDNSELIIQKEVAKQWWLSIYALINNNQPKLDIQSYKLAIYMQDLAWKEFTRLNKDTSDEG